MEIRLGNLTFRQLAEKHSIELSDEELKTLEALRNDNANFAAGSECCHIFDMPRIICCGTQTVFDTVLGILRSKKIVGQIQLGVIK